MRANEQFGEDDLAFYALHMLADPTASVVAEAVTRDGATRQLLGEVQAKLGAFAESSIELQAVPEGSWARLVTQIHQEGGRSPVVLAMPAAPSGRTRGRLIPWIGWAAAALLAVAVGRLYEGRTELQHRLSEKETAATRERETLQASAAAQAKEVAQLQAEVDRTRNAALGLRHAVAGQAAALNEKTEAATSAEHERDVLRGTLAAQAGQVAQLAADRQNAALVLDALRDPSALRVTLKKPSSKAAPEGRASYVASKGTLVFLANNLTPLRLHKVYELWLMPMDGSNPVPAGTFVPDTSGNASLIYPHFPNAIAARGFAVTIEAEGGSQSPTLPMILAGL